MIALVRKFLLLLLMPLALVACSAKDDVLKPSPLPDFERTVDVKTLWRSSAGDGTPVAGARLAPAVTGTTVYVLDGEGLATALDRRTGKRLWRRDTGLAFSAGPVAAFNQLFAGTREGELVALSGEDGSLLWRVAVSGEVLAPPVVEGDLVIVKNAGGRLVAVERESGSVRWTWDSGAPTLALRASSRPVVVADAVLAGLPGGMIAAVAHADGKLLWERRVAEPEGTSELDRLVDVAGDFVLRGDRLYVAAWQGRLVSVDLRSGQLGWQQPFSTHRDLALADDTVYAIDADSRLVAWRGSDGVALWRVEAFLGRELAGVAVTGDYLVAGDLDGYLHVISREDGRIVGRKRLAGDAIQVTPVVDENVLFVQGRGGRIAAFQVVDR